MMAKFLFERPVDDRHDKQVFMLAFFVGVVGILATRIFGDQFVDPTKPLRLFDFLAVIISVAVILLYTFYILRTTDRSSISLDRAGDNAYYLGLLFTLLSLSYSLYKVVGVITGSGGSQWDDASWLRSADRVIRLLPDFGLALASTIAGIFCRILVQQFRSDPADIETQARQELGQAVRELRASLLRAVADMNSLSRSTNAATTEMVLHINKTLEEAAATNAAAMTRVGSKLEGVVQESAEQVSKVSGLLEGVMQKSAEQVGKVSGLLEGVMQKLSDVVASVNDQLSRFNIDPTEVQGRLGALSAELEELRGQLSRTSENQQNVARELAEVSAQISSSFSADVAASLRSAADGTLRRQAQVSSELERLETSVSAASQIISGLKEEVSRTGDELAQTTETSRQALDRTVTASSEYVDCLTDAAKKLRRSMDDNT